MNINGEIVEYLRTGVTYQVGTPADFNTLSIDLDSVKNSHSATTMTVKFTIPMAAYEASPLLVVTFPS